MPKFKNKTRWLKSNLKRRTGVELPLDKLRSHVQEALLTPCPYCGVVLTLDNMSLDHMQSVENGGKTIFSNLELVCARCNQAKGSFNKEVFCELLKVAKKRGKKVLNTLLQRLRASTLVFRGRR